MNTKQLEIQAKALAGVVKQHVQRAVAGLRDEFQKLLDTRFGAMEQHLESEVAGLKTAVNEVKNEVKTGDFISREAARAMVAEAVSEHEMTIAEYKEQTDQLLSAVRGAIDGHGQSLDEQLGLIKDQLEALEVGEKYDPEAVKTEISEQIQQLKADIPAPQPGEPGKPGKDGKDALQLEVLPAIDFEKAYPRNTYALHNGGLLRAYQQTQGEKGWETVLNGVADVHIEQHNAREFTIKALQTNGKSTCTKFSVPVMVYRGVYREDENYQPGDVVTFAGSLWHTEQNSPPGKPGSGAPEKTGWTLAAKKGRDGKNSGDN